MKLPVSFTQRAFERAFECEIWLENGADVWPEPMTAWEILKIPEGFDGVVMISLYDKQGSLLNKWEF